MALWAEVQASDPIVLLRWCPSLSTWVLLEGACDRVEDDDSPVALTWETAALATFERKKELRVYTEDAAELPSGESLDGVGRRWRVVRAGTGSQVGHGWRVNSFVFTHVSGCTCLWSCLESRGQHDVSSSVFLRQFLTEPEVF